MTKTTESVLFLFSPPMQACYSLSSAPTELYAFELFCSGYNELDKISNFLTDNVLSDFPTHRPYEVYTVCL